MSQEVSSREKVKRLIIAFGKTMGEHSLSAMNHLGSESGEFNLRLNWKCDMFYDVEFKDMDDLWVQLEKRCKESGLDVDYGDFRVVYEFVMLENSEKYGDDVMEDEMLGSFDMLCHGFEIQDRLYDIHNESEEGGYLERYNLGVRILSYEKI